MTLQQLRYVVEVFHCGSITAAAQKLFISQPSLSKAVRELEEELGITIFERSRTGASFTAEGIELLTYAQSILEQAASMSAHFAKKESDEVLRLSISSQHYIFLIDAMIDFLNQQLAQAPRYTVNIREGKTSQVISDVLEQRSQLGVLYVSNSTRHFMRQLLLKHGLEFHPLGEFSSHVYLRASHPLAAEQMLSTAQLTPYPCVCYDQGGDSLNFSEEVDLPDMAKSIYVTDRSTMLSIIRNTDAYTTGSGCLLPHIISPGIVTIPLRGGDDRMQVGWIRQKGAASPPELEQFIRLMEGSLEKVLHQNGFTGGRRLPAGPDPAAETERQFRQPFGGEGNPPTRPWPPARPGAHCPAAFWPPPP